MCVNEVHGVSINFWCVRPWLDRIKLYTMSKKVEVLVLRYLQVGVRPGIQSEDHNQFFTFKVRTFWQSEVKISVLALWLGALYSLFHNMGVWGYGRYPFFVRARHVQRCVKKCPHTLNVLYTDLSSLWMPGRTHYTHVCIVCPHFECRDM